ncbi:MAG: hypothetical protein JSS58_03505 [Proteobacteria bacterium]|nr:hypothetical protein [Pseudomonadota bacterium]
MNTISDQEQEPRRPWIVLQSSYDVEAWIDNYNWDLRRLIDKSDKPGIAGYGICFCLTHGGEIYLHTTPDGEVLLDVTPEATWVVPVITAATGVSAPAGQVWSLSGEVLTQLVLGLSTLIDATRLVKQHDYRIRKL